MVSPYPCWHFYFLVIHHIVMSWNGMSERSEGVEWSE